MNGATGPGCRRRQRPCDSARGTGLASLVLRLNAAFALLSLVYASLAVIDPVSAERAEAPLWFRRLRPGQMTLAAAGLAGLWWLA